MFAIACDFSLVSTCYLYIEVFCDNLLMLTNFALIYIAKMPIIGFILSTNN
jgi:hypothetical protein